MYQSCEGFKATQISRDGEDGREEEYFLVLQVLLSHFNLEWIVLRTLIEEMLAVTKHLTCLQSGGSKEEHTLVCFSLRVVCLKTNSPFIQIWMPEKHRVQCCLSSQLVCDIFLN